MAKEKYTVCPECGENYDIHFYRCPNCRKPNENRPFTRMSYLPISRQVSLFVIGLVGLNVLSAILSIIFTTVIKDDEPYLYLVINTLSYLTLFVVDLLVIGKYFPELLTPFKKWRTYLAGLIGFAIVLAGSILIGLLMKYIAPSAGEGENQTVAIQMVLRGPLVSVITLGLIGPIVEELTYRVGLFTLCKRASSILAYAVTVIIFTVIHINFFSDNIINELIALPDYLFAGIIFAVLYHREGFGASLIAHMGNNLFSVLTIIITKGQ